MKTLIATLLVLFSPGTLVAAEPMSLSIWPDVAPGETKSLPPEADTTTEKSGLVAGPDFAVLVYPGLFTLKEENHRVQPLLMPDAAVTPPIFIAMAQDDPIGVENAVHYYIALKQANMPTELHLYPKGGHGFGLRRTDGPATWWPDRVTEWMAASGG